MVHIISDDDDEDLDEDLEVAEADDGDEAGDGDCPERPKTPAPHAAAAPTPQRPARSNQWPVTDKLVRKVEEQIQYALDHNLSTEGMMEYLPEQHPWRLSQESKKERTDDMRRKEALAKLKEMRKRKQDGLPPQSSPSEDKRSKSDWEMDYEEYEDQYWITKAAVFLATFPKDEDKLLDDLFLWQELNRRDLHHQIWLQEQPQEIYPWEDKWRKLKYTPIPSHVADQLKDKDEYLTEAALTTKALNMRNDIEFEENPMKHLSDLLPWVNRRRLHKALMDMYFPNQAQPNGKMWAAAEENITKTSLAEHKLKREMMRKAVKKLQQTTHEEDVKTLTWFKNAKRRKDVEKSKNEDDFAGKLMDLRDNKGKKEFEPSYVALGEGFVLANRMVNFTMGGQHGSYEAISIIKNVKPDEMKKEQKELAINMPLRNLSALYRGMINFREGINTMIPLPSLEELDREMASSEKRMVDLSCRTDLVPRVRCQLDDLLTVTGEKTRWGKADVEVITFTRVAKEKSKKGFTLQIPAKCFPALELAVTYLYCLHFNNKCFKLE